MCYQFCSEIYSLQEQMSVTDFSRMARLGRFTADCLWLKLFPGQARSRGGAGGARAPPEIFRRIKFCYKSGTFLLKWTAVNGS